MTLVGTRVLVIEDEALVSMLIEDFLAELGCDVVATASRLEDALAKAGEVVVDVALLDVNLAGQASYAVADVLRARHIPLVFATGYGASGVPGPLADVPVLSKPFQRHKLATALCQACAAR